MEPSGKAAIRPGGVARAATISTRVSAARRLSHHVDWPSLHSVAVVVVVGHFFFFFFSPSASLIFLSISFLWLAIHPIPTCEVAVCFPCETTGTRSASPRGVRAQGAGVVAVHDRIPGEMGGGVVRGGAAAGSSRVSCALCVESKHPRMPSDRDTCVLDVSCVLTAVPTHDRWTRLVGSLSATVDATPDRVCARVLLVIDRRRGAGGAPGRTRETTNTRKTKAPFPNKRRRDANDIYSLFRYLIARGPRRPPGRTPPAAPLPAAWDSSRYYILRNFPIYYF